MKKFIINDICHIKPSTDELEKNNSMSQDIIVDNYANLIPKLKDYNKAGYNIYKAFNTFFDGKRRTENLNELRAILIDLDYKDKEKEDYISLRKKCKFLEQKYGIFPFEINDTYKGYHLLFGLDKSLHYIKNEYYLDIANALIEFFNRDTAAKQITGLYKMVGFIDHKDNRNFLIENIYSATEVNKLKHSINIDTLKSFGTIEEEQNLKSILKDKIYGIKAKWDSEGKMNASKFELLKNTELAKIYELIEKKTGKHEIYELIENIDANTFIDAINEYDKGYFKDVHVLVNNKSIDGTGGLKLYYNKGKWEIKDFATDKKRFGNRLFLINHILKINEEKSNNIKKKKIIDYLSFLREKFGIIFNKSQTSFFISSKIIYDYIMKKITISDEILNDLLLKYDVDYKIKNKLNYIDTIIYIYFIIEHIKQTEYMNYQKINIPYKKILSILGLNDTNDNKNRLKFFLDIGSKIIINYDFINEKGKKINIDKNIYNVKLGEKSFEYYSLISNKNIESENSNKGYILLKDNIFNSKGFSNKDNLKMLLYSIYSIKKFGTVKLSISQILKLLNKDGIEYSDDNYVYKKINIIMKQLKSDKIINYFSRHKGTYTIGKKEKIDKKKKK